MSSVAVADSLSVATGRVKWFDRTKRFGFIVPDDGSLDILVHLTCVLAGRWDQEFADDIQVENAIVEVEFVETKKGRQAVTLRSVRLDPKPRSAVPIPDSEFRELPERVVTIKWFNSRRGFGFGVCDEVSGDIFVHAGVLRRYGVSPANIRIGDELVVRYQKGSNGYHAVTARLPREFD